MTEPAVGGNASSPSTADTAGDLAVNRDLWTVVNEQFTDDQAIAAWSTDELSWGLFGNPESTLRVLGDVAGLDVIELGCGTAFVSAWLARLGARPVGVDLTPAQLATARRCQDRFGLTFPLIEADAAAVPLPDRTFDLVVSEYGACVWCDPQRWVPEAARLLRPGGRLVFLTNSVQVTMCVPDDGGHAGDRLAPAAESGTETGVVGWWRRVPPQSRRMDPHPARQRVRGRRSARALRGRGRRNSCLLRHRDRRVGQPVAGGGPVDGPAHRLTPVGVTAWPWRSGGARPGR